MSKTRGTSQAPAAADPIAKVISGNRSRLRSLLLSLLVSLTPLTGVAQDVAVTALASLTEPAKLATLAGDRAVNPRLLKCVYWLNEARLRGREPVAIIIEVQGITNSTGECAAMVRAGLVRNLDIAEKLGCLTASNLQLLPRGRSPTVMRGPYAGELAEVDHIVPIAVAPELCNEIANLELMPRTLNRRKGVKMGQRQLDYLQRFRAAGLLPDRVRVPWLF